MKAKFARLNHTAYGSPEYVKVCLEVGEFDEALANVSKLRGRGSRILAKEVKRSIPKEILDIKFLSRYINENMPESSWG